MKTHVEFRSAAFPPYEGEEDEINPGRYGKRVAEFLIRGLKQKGFQPSEPVAEDWGWVVPIQNDAFRLWIGCGNYDEYPDGFLCFIEPHQPTIRNARGLMQIMPATGEELARRLGHPWHGPDALFDPTLNLKLGTAYLRQLLNRYNGNVETALAAYNWGPGHIDRRIASGVSLPRLYPQLVRDALERRIDQRS